MEIETQMRTILVLYWGLCRSAVRAQNTLRCGVAADMQSVEHRDGHADQPEPKQPEERGVARWEGHDGHRQGRAATEKSQRAAQTLMGRRQGRACATSALSRIGADQQRHAEQQEQGTEPQHLRLPPCDTVPAADARPAAGRVRPSAPAPP